MQLVSSWGCQCAGNSAQAAWQASARRQVKDDREEDGEPRDSGFLRTVRTAAYRVKEHPARICNAATLEAVKGIGPALSRVRACGHAAQ